MSDERPQSGEEEGLRAGAGRAVIGPSRGVYLAGYGHPWRFSKGDDHPLTVSAVLLDDGGRHDERDAGRALILSVDALAIHEDATERLRKRLAKAAEVDPDAILVACSHSHSTPVLTDPDFARDSQHGWVERFEQAAEDAALQARDSLESARLFHGVGSTRIAINRRETNDKGKVVIGENPDGPVDDDVVVIELRRPRGEVVATLTNLACHPTILSPRQRRGNPDWPGFMRRHVEHERGGVTLFLQGGTGDLNPREGWGPKERESVERIGLEAGRDVVDICEHSTRPIDEVSIDARRAMVQLGISRRTKPNGTPMTLRQAIWKTARIPGFLSLRLLDHMYPMRGRSFDLPDGGHAVEMETQVLRIGPLAIATHASEAFTETGLSIKAASPADSTLFVGYANGMVGYLPPAVELERGGYEVDMACHFYRYPGPFAEGAEQTAVEATTELLRELFD